MIDIEALGLVPGSEIIELAAVLFDPATGKTGAEFFRRISPTGQPYHCDLDTLNWHRSKRSFPRDGAENHPTILFALADFLEWIENMPEAPAVYWSWGSTYDFPLLTFAFAASNQQAPWRYWQCQCARTIWNTAFPYTKTKPRTHNALQDCKDAAADLSAALNSFHTH
jgi:exodeoxyribonuclease VIII